MKLRNSNPRTGSNKAWLPVAVALALGVTACDRERSQVENVAGTTVNGEANQAEVADTAYDDADFDSNVSGTTTGATDAETGMETGATASRVSSEASGMNDTTTMGTTAGTTTETDAKAAKKTSAKRMKKSTKQNKGTTSGATTGGAAAGSDMTNDTTNGMGTDSGMTTGDESDTRDIYDRSHTPQPGEEGGIGESRDSSAIDTSDESMTDSAMSTGPSQEEMVSDDRDVVSGTTTGSTIGTTTDEMNRDTTHTTDHTSDAMIGEERDTASSTTTESMTEDQIERDTARTTESVTEEEYDTTSGTTTSGMEEDETTRTTDSMMEEDTDTMSGTTTGTTSGSMDRRQTMTGEMSKDKSSEQILSRFNPASIAISPYTYEPYSRMPAHIGSVQITGKDKSVAVLERMSRFTDPNALVRNTNSKMATRPLPEINISDYDFDRRGAFQSDMHARLLNLDQRMEIIRAQAIGSASEREQMLTNLSQLEGQHNALERRVDFADAVNSSQWNNWRSSFRSELAELERQIAEIGVALR